MARPDMAGRSYLTRIAQPIPLGSKPLRARVRPVWDEPPPQERFAEASPMRPLAGAARAAAELPGASAPRSAPVELSLAPRTIADADFSPGEEGDRAPRAAAPPRSPEPDIATTREPSTRPLEAEVFAPSSPIHSLAPVKAVEVDSHPAPAPAAQAQAARGRLDASEHEIAEPARFVAAARTASAPPSIGAATPSAEPGRAAAETMAPRPTAEAAHRSAEAPAPPRQEWRGARAADDLSAGIPSRAPAKIAAAPEPRVRIGTVEVRIAAPTPPAASPRPAAPAARSPHAEALSRGLASRFGLVQG
jgi:hypothetical protein